MTSMAPTGTSEQGTALVPAASSATTTTRGRKWLDRRSISVAFVSATVVLSLLVLSSISSTYSTRRLQDREQPWTRLLEHVLSPETMRELREDRVLRKTYVDALGFGSAASRSLGSKFAVPALARVGDDVDLHVRGLSARDLSDDVSVAMSSTASGMFDDIGDYVKSNLAGAGFFIGTGMAQGTVVGLNISTAEDAKMVAQKVADENKMEASVLDVLMESTAKGATGTVVGAVASNPGMYGYMNTLLVQAGPALQGLGTGLGNGAASGLKLTKANLAPNVSESDVPAMADAFAYALSYTFLSNVNTTELLHSARGSQGLSQAYAALPGAAAGFGIGLGNGVATGFQLTQSDLAPDVNSTELPNIANNFAFGLGNALTSNINVTDLIRTAHEMTGAYKLSSQLPSIASGFGAGLGSGTAVGLKLVRSDEQISLGTPEQQNDVLYNVVRSFAFSLTSSLTEDLNTSAIAIKVGGGDASKSVLAALPDAAAGLGKGLGEGAAIGLGLQDDRPVTLKDTPAGTIDVGGVVRSFAQSLVSGFLTTDSVSRLSSEADLGFGSLGEKMKVDFGRVAQGFATGLMQGVGDGVESMGGIESILNGNTTVARGDISTTPLRFDDSVSGAAVGFGQGLGSQGSLVVQKLLRKVKTATIPAGDTQAQAQAPAQAGPARIPEIAAPQAAPHAPGSVSPSLPRPSSDTVPDMIPHLAPRQADVMVGLEAVNLSVVLNTRNFETVLQRTMDVVTCEGVGGLALLIQSLKESGQLVPPTDPGLARVMRSLLPHGIVTITNGPVRISADGQALGRGFGPDRDRMAALNAVTVNGRTLPLMIAIIVVHAVLAIAVLMNLLPLVVALESLHNLLGRYSRVPMPRILTHVPKLNNLSWLIIIAPSLVLVLISGILAAGSGKHFQTVHGMLSLVDVVLGTAAITLHYLVKTRAKPATGRSRNKLVVARSLVNMAFLVATLAAALTGFVDLSTASLCITHLLPFAITIALGFGLAAAAVLGCSLAGVELLVLCKSSAGRGAEEKVRLLDGHAEKMAGVGT